jgi:hypothetical protein
MKLANRYKINVQNNIEIIYYIHKTKLNNESLSDIDT